MNIARPTAEDYFLMGRAIHEEVDELPVVVFPVDHGAYSDSLHMRRPFETAGLNVHFYERGPYTQEGRKVQDTLYECAHRYNYFDKGSSVKTRKWLPHLASILKNRIQQYREREENSHLELDDCLDQSNALRFGEYRTMLTPLSEALFYITQKVGAHFAILFEDYIGYGTASSGIGAYVYGFELARMSGIDGFFLASSVDSSGGVAHFAAVRPKPLIYPTPEDWIFHNAPHTWRYLNSFPEFEGRGVGRKRKADKPSHTVPDFEQFIELFGLTPK